MEGKGRCSCSVGGRGTSHVDLRPERPFMDVGQWLSERRASQNGPHRKACLLIPLSLDISGVPDTHRR